MTGAHAHHWAELDRARLAELLPRAVVVLSLGATEQHGNHLPTGTDALISQAVLAAAADGAAARGADLVVAPPLWVGASEHHLTFGGTLSLRAETLLAVLVDLLGAMAASGARRILIVNGHGGNSGVCHAAASTVAARHDVAVAHLDYWQLVDTAVADSIPVPGHAGAFETSLIMAVRPDLAGIAVERPAPPAATAPAFTLHSADAWRRMDGWTDTPGSADPGTGAKLFSGVVEALSQALVDWEGT